MPKTQSNSITLGTRAADFVLPTRGNLFTLAEFKDSPALLVAFISNRCPFVVLIREALAKFAGDYAGQGSPSSRSTAMMHRRFRKRRSSGSAQR